MGGVVDGQPVNQTITNAAFIEKNADDTTTFKLGLNRPASAPAVASAQDAINKLYTASGASEIATGTVYGAGPNTITNGDSYETALFKLAEKFEAATGHTHDGSDGNGGPIAGGSGGTFVEAPLSNNQVSPSDVTGFLVNSAVNYAFAADASIARRHMGASDGAPVNTFNTSLGDPSFDAQINGVAVQPDRKVIVVGNFTLFKGNPFGSIMRFNQDGSVDTTFNPGGAGSLSALNAVKLQSTGKIVVGGINGNTYNGTSVGSIFRLNSDGSLDTAFTASVGTTSGSIDDIDIDSGDAIVGVGRVSSVNGTNTHGIAKLSSAGVLDTVFYTNLGTGFPTGSAHATEVKIQANGQIVVGGGYTVFNGLTRLRLVRLNSDGTEDTSFYTNIGTGAFNGSVSALYVQGDQKILVGGVFSAVGTNSISGIVRLNTDGTQDAAFTANAGSVTGGAVFDIAIQSDLKIVLVGDFSTQNGNTRVRIVRLNNSGTEDAAFYTAVATSTSFDVAILCVAVSPDDLVLVGGQFLQLNGVNRKYLALLGTVSTEVEQTMLFWGRFKTLSSSWELSVPEGAFDDAGVLLSITPLGQVQYTSTNLSGTIIQSVMRFIVRGL